MATYVWNSSISQSTNTTFQAWVNEIFTALVTQCGLTQTADTGQMAVPCVSAVPAINTLAGYYVFSFNDTLQGTAPIFLRLDFGTGSVATLPLIEITVGTGSNGAGTITGLGSAAINKFGVSVSVAPGGGAFNSYACYNATQGVLWVVGKLGAPGAGYNGQFAFGLWRTVNPSGAPTADGLYVMTTSNVTGAGTYGCTTILNYNTSAIQYGPASWFQIGGLTIVPFGETATIQGTTGQVFPVFQYKGNATTPGVGITNAVTLAAVAEIPVATTVSANILGSLTMTYLSVGSFGPYTTYGCFGYGTGNWTTLLLWQ